MRNTLLAFAFVATGFAADSGFNGRWDIRVLNEPRNRAWWLEVTGAGTPQIKGRFVGFPGGDMNDIQKIWIDRGVLHFTFDRQNVHQEYSAKLAGNKLEGTFTQNDRTLNWVGERAPEIKEKDDGTWREGKPIALLNGKDLSGWHGLVPGKDLGWTVHDGMLSSTGGANNLETDGKYWNFKLHVEYRVGPHSNSGIGLRGRYEVQILEDAGRPIDRHSNGALYSRILPTENVSKAAGEWQTYDIRLVGRDVTITLNGKMITKGVIEGLTAIASDPDEGKPGPITLQGDHGPVDFRSIVLTPLVK
jgi:hypothetical protein